MYAMQETTDSFQRACTRTAGCAYIMPEHVDIHAVPYGNYEIGNCVAAATKAYGSDLVSPPPRVRLQASGFRGSDFCLSLPPIALRGLPSPPRVLVFLIVPIEASEIVLENAILGPSHAA